MSSAAGNETNKTAENSSLQVQPTIAPTLSPIPVEGQVFAGFVVFTGFLSMLANGLVMSILIVVNRQKRKSTNVLIVNQMAIDLFTCGCITITYAVRLQNYYFVGLWGDIMCKLVDNEYFIWIGLNASVASLCIITFERYLKVVHSLFHRKYFRKWMIPVAVAFGWGIGFFTNTPVAWLTSSVVDGVCYGSVFFPSADSMAAYGIYYFIFTFFGPLVLFVYCYGHIVFIIRKQLKIHPLQDPAGDQPEPVNNIVRKNTARSQVNVIKVMIIVNAFFVACWLPNQVYYLLGNLQVRLSITNGVWYGTELIVLLNIGVNPFIYASQYDIIKNHIGRMFGRQQEQTTES